MEEVHPRAARRKIERRRTGAEAPFTRHPDRIALWAVLLAVFATIVAAGTAHAMGGGVSSGSGSGPATAYAANAKFGSRPLRKGDKGDDVKTLNWLLKSLPGATGVPAGGTFGVPTAKTVRNFQRGSGLGVDGIVATPTRSALIGTMQSGAATWYSLIGNRTACGVVLTPKTLGVANNTLPCGTRVTFFYNGRFARAPVIDTGAFGCGSPVWDLTYGLKQKLRFGDSGNVQYAVAGGKPAC